MKVIWTRRAVNHLHRIERYVLKHSPRGAERVWTRIVERVEAQAATPLAAPLERSGPARKLVVTRTPYIVLYAVQGDELRVLGVFHAAQNR